MSTLWDKPERPGPYMYVLSQWQLDDLRHEWLISDEGEAAVNAAANAYHETECVYHTERDALAATVARVKVEGDRWANSKNYTVQFAGGLIREVLRPVCICGADSDVRPDCPRHAEEGD